MNCTKCKRELPDGAKFCPWCGQRDPQKERRGNTKKRGNGTGSVWLNPKTKTWTAQVSVGYYNGRRVRRTKKGLRTKKEALEALPVLSAGRLASRDMKVSSIWEAMSPKWLDGLSDGKRDHYNRAYKRLSALWGADITRLITQDWQNEIDKIPGKYDPKKDAKIVASKIYQYAIAQGWISVNMAQFVELPGQTPSKKDAFTTAELDALWKAWMSGYCWIAYILIMCYTGMRPGELRKVLISDIHLNEGYMVGGIKSEAGKRRCISFPAFLQAPLEWAIANGKNGKLLSINEQNFYEEYSAALDKAGILRTEQRKMTPHCCRHTFVTMGTNSGIPLAVLQKMAGHSDPSVTAGYNHTHDPELIRAAQSLYRPSFLNG